MLKITNNSISVGSSAGSVVVNDGEVFINGDRCYPHDLIKELDEAWRQKALHNGPIGDIHGFAEAERRLARIRRVLDLA